MRDEVLLQLADTLFYFPSARHYSEGRFISFIDFPNAFLRESSGTAILSRSVRDTENQTPASGKCRRHHSDPRNHRKTLHLDHLRDGRRLPRHRLCKALNAG